MRRRRGSTSTTSRRRKGSAALAVGLALLSAAGCASARTATLPTSATSTAPARTAPPPDLLRVTPGALVPVGEPALDEALRGAQVVYLGEHHDDPHMHKFEYEMLVRVYEMDHSAALGIEMLPRSMQPALDDYLAGKTDEDAFLAAVDWDKTWGFPFAYYQPLLAFCRAHRLPVFALNAEARLAREVAHKGTAALSDADRRLLPEMRPGPAAHRAQLEAAFQEHGAHAELGPEALEHFYEAQLVWDETMAESVARVVAGGDAPRHLVVVAGEGHVRRFAVPERARRRGVKCDLVVLPAYPKGATLDEAEGADFLFVLHPRPTLSARRD